MKPVFHPYNIGFNLVFVPNTLFVESSFVDPKYGVIDQNVLNKIVTVGLNNIVAASKFQKVFSEDIDLSDFFKRVSVIRWEKEGIVIAGDNIGPDTPFSPKRLQSQRTLKFLD